MTLNYFGRDTELRKFGYILDLHVDQWLPPLQPKLNKDGTVSKRQPYRETKPDNYWRAQCAFRELPVPGTVAELQAQIRQRNLALDKSIADKLEQKGATINGREYEDMVTEKAKVEKDPGRFLRDIFVDADTPPPVLVIKTHARSSIHRAAEPLKLSTYSTDAPLNEDGSKPDIDRWIVISRDRNLVSKKINEISREARVTQQKKKDRKRKEVQEQHEEFLKRVNVKKPWDITGTWAIQFPAIEEGWSGSDELSMNIYIEKTAAGRQMWADFDFNVVTGVMRFVRPANNRDPRSDKAAAPSSRKRKRDDEEEGEDEETDKVCGVDEDEDEDEDEEETPEEFILGPKDQPSARSKAWTYRWRGEETGEGQIQVADGYLCTMKFGGPGGIHLSATFQGCFVGEAEFTGLKIGAASALPGSDPDEEWAQRSEGAYERARVNRWH